jgi:hypothetical protein
MDELPPDVLLAAYPAPIGEAAARLRAAVRRVVPDAIEGVRSGWKLIGYRVPAGRKAAYFGFVAPEPVHVHLGFEYGMLLDDPDELLGGRWLRQVRFFTFEHPDEIRDEVIEPFIREAARLAALGRAERLALTLDRERDA